MSRSKTLSSATVASNKWTTIVEERFILENGYQGQYLIVERAPALMIIPLLWEDHQWYTYMVRQHRHPIERSVWQFPMGTLDAGNDALDHAREELQQETGLVARQLTPIVEYFVDPGLSRQKCIVYIAESIIEGGKQALDESEFDLKYKKIPVSALSAMIQQGEIIDSWGLSGVYLLFVHINKNDVLPAENTISTGGSIPMPLK